MELICRGKINNNKLKVYLIFFVNFSFVVNFKVNIIFI